MAESQTFYLSYAPCLEVLQNRGNGKIYVQCTAATVLVTAIIRKLMFTGYDPSIYICVHLETVPIILTNKIIIIIDISLTNARHC